MKQVGGSQSEESKHTHVVKSEKPIRTGKGEEECNYMYLLEPAKRFGGGHRLV